MNDGLPMAEITGPWPQVGCMLTVRSQGRSVTGVLRARADRQLQVETWSGDLYVAPLITAQRVEWGVYCPHGTKIVEAEDAEHTCEAAGPLLTIDEDDPICIPPRRDPCLACYPTGRKILPWACEEEDCTEAGFDREQQEEEEAYYEELRHSYYG